MEEKIYCPKCNYEYPYLQGKYWHCPDCNHQWDPSVTALNEEETVAITDANGNKLSDGDVVTIIKDLKVKGASNNLKVGTKVKNIRLIHESADGHDISCNIPGFGAIKLKSIYVKKG